ncbi:LINE-1 retrotransposable element ORF2 protein [Camelus dromedarius]|uniref:LINE-1 retrotransposable element ORF2 protein n=1 Tax=Camelus dromedarius TaxID=9838 RepID=A0A5N4C030_CAMDR|nr:LINE-1 retrotransposable element ORF2 protein [Camelus dromedarius]
MFTAALLTIAKTWKQPKCPLTGDCIKKMWYIYTMEYYSIAGSRGTMGSSGYHSEWRPALLQAKQERPGKPE